MALGFTCHLGPHLFLDISNECICKISELTAVMQQQSLVHLTLKFKKNVNHYCRYLIFCNHCTLIHFSTIHCVSCQLIVSFNAQFDTFSFSLIFAFQTYRFIILTVILDFRFHPMKLMSCMCDHIQQMCMKLVTNASFMLLFGLALHLCMIHCSLSTNPFSHHALLSYSLLQLHQSRFISTRLLPPNITAHNKQASKH